MKKRTITILFLMGLLYSLCPANAYLQEINLFEKGTSGFCISGGYTTSEDGNGFGFSAGFSIESLIDLGVSYCHLSIDMDDYTQDMNVKGICPYIGINLIKQSRYFPVNLSVFGYYDRYKFTNDALDASGIAMKGTDVGFGGMLYGLIPISSKLNIIPSAGIKYVKAEIEMEDYYGNSLSLDNEYPIYQFGIGFGILLESQQIFYTHPTISVDEDGFTVFSVSIGFAFPMNQSQNERYDGKNNSDLEKLFRETNKIYIDLKNINKNYLLISIGESIVMERGERYPIVRFQNPKDMNSRSTKIGSANVVKIRGNKIALEYRLINPNDILTINDKIEYH